VHPWGHDFREKPLSQSNCLFQIRRASVDRIQAEVLAIFPKIIGQLFSAQAFIGKRMWYRTAPLRTHRNGGRYAAARPEVEPRLAVLCGFPFIEALEDAWVGLRHEHPIGIHSDLNAISRDETSL
jgi:hypothetical protein